VPPKPGAWLTTTATRRAIDRIRRESKRDDKHKEARMAYDDDPPEPLGAIDDDRLRLIFTCCHPALAMEARLALTMRLVGGLTMPEIARAFLVSEAAMGQRITRAKAKIKAARIPALIAEGHSLVRERLASGAAPGRYQLLAAINAVHTSARDMRDTDWSQVLALYDQLVRLDPSPVIALNRAIAVAELDGPQVALPAVDRLEPDLTGYHAYYATRADLLRRLGRVQESRAAYERAIELAGNTAETAYLTRRRDQLV
jgi:predicted RNA polymerase sigma factor